MTRPAPAVWRWLLVVGVLSGVFAMHVLAAPEDGGHGMTMAAPTMTAMTDPSGPAAGPGGMSDGMAMCVLFLTSVSVLIGLGLLAFARVRRDPARLAGPEERLPPPRPPPRSTLCVLRT